MDGRGLGDDSGGGRDIGIGTGMRVGMGQGIWCGCRADMPLASGNWFSVGTSPAQRGHIGMPAPCTTRTQ